MKIRVEIYNSQSPRARLTITDGDAAVCMSVPVRPWLRLSGWWFLHSRKALQEALRNAGIEYTEDAIHDAIQEVWDDL